MSRVKASSAVLSLAALAVACEPDVKAVTGGPEQGVTPEYEQAETAITVAHREPLVDVITIAFNDRTQDPSDPKTVYPSPEERIIYRGESLMGWSTSSNDGASFAYRGKVSPPTDWAVIWGDPSLTTAGSSSKVYLATLGVSNLTFPGMVTGSMHPYLDGFCVARSIDSGENFNDVACFKNGRCADSGARCKGVQDCGSHEACEGIFYDGTTLAANNSTVYFAAFNDETKQFDVWRADTSGLDFERMEDVPFKGRIMTLHPRLRFFGPRLYLLGHDVYANVLATYLDPGSATWSPSRRVANIVNFAEPITLSDGRTIRTANQFSFDIGLNPQTEANELRVAVTHKQAGTLKRYLQVYNCPWDLPPAQFDRDVTDCDAPAGWSTVNAPGDQWSPLLKVAGSPPKWKLVWRSRGSDPDGNVIGHRQGDLFVLPNGDKILVGLQLVEPQVPCNAQDLSNPNAPGYWGDYDDLTNLIAPLDFNTGSPRFVTAFTDNRSGCDFRTKWTADMHVGAAVIQ